MLTKSNLIIVPIEDSANDIHSRDVIGKKSDTTAGDSLVALTKIVDSVVDGIDTKADTISTAVVTTIPGTITTAQSDITAIKAVTDVLPDAGALTTIDTNIDDIETAVVTTIPGTITTLNTAVITDIPASLVTIDTVVDTNQDLLDGTTATPTAYRREYGVAQIKATTIDLEQAAASYDLFTGTTQDCILESLSIRLPNVDCSDDINLTSITIQTDDVTPQVIFDSTDGAVANLTAEAQLAYTGAIYIKVGTKVQLTIAGGASDAATVCDVVTKYISNVDGGYLA